MEILQSFDWTCGLPCRQPCCKALQCNKLTQIPRLVLRGRLCSKQFSHCRGSGGFVSEPVVSGSLPSHLGSFRKTQKNIRFYSFAFRNISEHTVLTTSAQCAAQKSKRTYVFLYVFHALIYLAPSLASLVVWVPPGCLWVPPGGPWRPPGCLLSASWMP